MIQLIHAAGGGSALPFRFGDFYPGSSPFFANTGQPFTVTNVNCTPAMAFIGDRPMVTLAGAGAATDGSQHQLSDACIRPYAAKWLTVYSELYSADITNHEVFIGLASNDTTFLAGRPNDYVGISKAAGGTVFKVDSLKGGGTLQSDTIGNWTLASSTLYTVAVAMLADDGSSGSGRVKVFLGTNPAPGALMTLVYDSKIATEFPDNVDMAPIRAFRAGGLVTTACSFGAFGWASE